MNRHVFKDGVFARAAAFLLALMMVLPMFPTDGAAAAARAKKKGTAITAAYDSLELNIGQYKRLQAGVENDADAVLKYSCDNEAVAHVSKFGKVTAKAAGECTVTITAADGTVKEVPVLVRPDVKKIALSDKKIKLYVMDKKQLEVTFKPAGSYQKITWTSSDPEIATVSSKGVVKALKPGEAIITASTSSGLSKTCKVVTSYSKVVAITFDDGPGQYTEKLLDALKEMDVHVTFFMVGKNVSRYPSLVKRMKEEGHELGNHSWDHPQLTTLSAEGVQSTIKKTSKAIKEACGSNPTLVRPPYGDCNSTVLANLGYPAIFWSIDTLDWKYRDKDYVKRTLINNSKDGAIVLLHDIHETSVNGAIAAIKQMKKDGWGFLTVTELITQNGHTIEAGKRYSQYKD